MSDEVLQSLGKVSARRGRPTNRSRAMAPALDAEVTDATFWNLVRHSQLRPSEEPSFDRVDFCDANGGGASTMDEDEAFIDGLIRLPSFDLLENGLSSTTGTRSVAARPSPNASSALDGIKFNNIFSVDSATSERGMASRAASGNAIDTMLVAAPRSEQVTKVLAGSEEGNDSLYTYGTFKKAKIGRPPTRSLTTSELPYTASSPRFGSNEPNPLSKLPGGAARKKVLERYHEKKKARTYGKHIQYEARKVRAETRRRVGGRFAKAETTGLDGEFRGPVPA